ncbi:MAG: undecaprenyl/decaprenyl-phosphate alpha-N-acetylglucosaminyl 1-phosphate transferase [Bacteroidetes bacterium]|nr:undecaprenyl/decaprenyl-phosphate alpha-N-acetylglucosaminyl 1-phosphate transferase [Bacteroidota bacterium]
MEKLPLVFLTSFFVVLLANPALIKVALLKRLFDEPGDERKIHTRRIPTIGGIMLFGGTIFTYALWYPIPTTTDFQVILEAFNNLKYLVATTIILFFVGIKDDIIGTAPVKKLVAHIIVGMILVLMADVRITSMDGIFGVYTLPYWASIFLSMFTYIVVVNAFNLIDGVDGLAGGVGFIASVLFGCWFIIVGDSELATLSFALGGSLLAFLIFNFQPAKLFMGDSGSLTIGLILCVLAIRVIEYDPTVVEKTILRHVSQPVFAMAVLVYPLIDTLRIFIYRSLKGLSPFSADKNHIHHKLIGLGLKHKGTVIIIYVFNIVVVGAAIVSGLLQPTFSFLLVFFVAAAATQIPFLIAQRKSITKKADA